MMSAAPYLPPSAARSSVMSTVPLSTGSATICHLIGSEEPKRGPCQYVHFASSIARVPSMIISAPGSGFAPTPTLAAAAMRFRRDQGPAAAAPSTIVTSSRLFRRIAFLLLESVREAYQRPSTLAAAE